MSQVILRVSCMFPSPTTDTDSVTLIISYQRITSMLSGPPAEFYATNLVISIMARKNSGIWGSYDNDSCLTVSLMFKGYGQKR